MASLSARTAASDSGMPRSEPSYYAPAHAGPKPAPRVLWPWPMFLLGIAALVGVWYGRPYLRINPAERVQRDLKEMRTIVERQPAEIDRAETLGRRILELGDPHPYPHLVGEAHFLMGCICARRADDPVNSNVAESWENARAHFEAAEKAGVTEGDAAHLSYGLAKAWHHLKIEPEQVIARLLIAEDPEDRAEKWQLLAEAYLRLPTPNLQAALEARKQQIAFLPATTEPHVVAQARYQLADLHLKLNQPQEARRALERIDSEAAGEVYYPSRVLLAQCLQNEGNFVQAAKTWEQAKANPRAAAAELGRIYYELGHCYAKSQRPDDANRAWKQAQLRGGEAGQAATLRVAELMLEDKSTAPLAIPIFEEGLRGIGRPSDYQNSLYSLKAVHQTMEQAIRQFQAAGDIIGASKLSEMFVRISGPGRSREMQVELADSLGQKLLAEAKRKTSPEADLLIIEARTQFRRAGTLAIEAAGGDRPADEQVTWLVKAAELLFKTRDPADANSALLALDRVIALQKTAGGIDPKVWFFKAMAHQELRQHDEAMRAYRECSMPGSPYEARARYQIAKIDLADLTPDSADLRSRLQRVVADLEKNLTRDVQQSDPELHEHSLYLLGNVVYQQNNHLEAMTRLQAALEQYPKSEYANNAKFLIGRCFWYQAARDSQKLQNPATPKKDFDLIRTNYKENLKQALKHFDDLEVRLLERGRNLTPDETILLRQTSFGAAECCFFMEAFDDAVRRYNLLRLRYAEKVEELVILSQLWQCHYIYMKQLDKAQSMYDALRDLLHKLPDSTFDGSSNVHKREFWQNWLQQAAPKSAAAPAAKS